MMNKQGITSPLIGATKLDQLQENIAALEFKLVRSCQIFLDKK